MGAFALLARRFCADRGGSVIIIFTFALIAFMGTAALAIDASRAYALSQRISSILDAAALAGAKLLDRPAFSDAQVIAHTTAVFEAHRNQISDPTVSLVNFTALPDRTKGEMLVSVDVDLTTYFGNLADMFGNMGGATLVNTKTFSFHKETLAVYRSTKIDLSLVLDVTGSMNGAKLSGLKTAAKSLVDTLYSGNPDAGSVRVALVPYSAAVNVGSYSSSVAHTPDSDQCVIERDGPNAHTDVPPGGGNYFDSRNDVPSSHTSWYSCPNAPIVPLADLRDPGDRNAFKATIDSMSAGGMTAGHLGTAWGWYTISENWNSFWPSASQPRQNGANTIKAIILMTDGMFNIAYKNGGETYPSDPDRTNRTLMGTAPNQADILCDAIKAENIRIYTIAFDAPADAELLMQDCADDSGGRYYNAANVAELVAAFEAIATDLTNLALKY